MDNQSGIWPPVYDFEQLGQQINALIDDGSIFSQFYELHNKDHLCQGDVVALKSNPIFIDEDGEIALIEEEYPYWLILGNTCDLARENNSSGVIGLPHLTHITPLIPLEEDVPPPILSDFRHYKYFKRMYLPPWERSLNHHYVDFTIINSVEKNFLVKKGTVEARMNFNSWILFHSCIVRYLARDDGRND